MGSSRRKHSREFKLEAVRQVVEHGRSVSEVAEGLGVNRNLLTRWKAQFEAEGAKSDQMGLPGAYGVLTRPDGLRPQCAGGPRNSPCSFLTCSRCSPTT